MSVPFSGVNLGGRGSGSTEFRFFQANFREILIFSRQFHKKCFFRQIFEKFRFFRQIFFTNFGFSKEIFEKFLFFSGKFSKEFKFFRQLKKSISRQKLLISSYFWVNYSIYLQKSPLSNILPVHDTIYHDPSTAPLHAIPSCQKSGASQPPIHPKIDAPVPLHNCLSKLFVECAKKLLSHSGATVRATLLLSSVICSCVSCMTAGVCA